MKPTKAAVRRNLHSLPVLRFEDQRLTSFSGLILFQQLFAQLHLKERLRACFAHLRVSPIFGHHRVVLLLVVHLLLGYRQLRDIRFYRDDPMVKRLLGLTRLPDVATISRALASAAPRSVDHLRALCRQLCLDRLVELRPARLTLDFDGSVLSTRRMAEGTAVGFNKKRKGARSYYPLFCTLAQTGQIFDLLHRPGNVHDSRGAKDFILACIGAIRAVLPGVQIEARLDSAFFSDEIVQALDHSGIEFTLSVPFERLPKLKALIEGKPRWQRIDATTAAFEPRWKPKSWRSGFRFVCLRSKAKLQHKGPVQLDLFVPYEFGFEFKAIVTNKTMGPNKILTFHNGRGAQEAIFAQCKSQCQMDYVAVRRLAGNQIYLLSAVLAHNLGRELQMATRPPERGTTEKRTPLWIFQEMNTLRRNLIQRAGRLTRPQGRLTLTMSANPAVREELLRILSALRRAA